MPPDPLETTVFCHSTDASCPPLTKKSCMKPCFVWIIFCCCCPPLYRVSVPRSVLQASYKVRPHRRRSFDPTDSMGLAKVALKKLCVCVHVALLLGVCVHSLPM